MTRAKTKAATAASSAAAALKSPAPKAGSKRKAKAEPEEAVVPAAAAAKAVPAAAAAAKKGKKQKQAAKPEPAPVAPPSKNPFKDAHFKSLDDVVDRCRADGSMLVVGLPTDDICNDEDEGEDEDEEETDDRVLTAEQVAVLRHIIITPRRSKVLDEAVNKVTGGEGFAMFNTNTGNQTIDRIAADTKKLVKLKDPAERFDMLFAMTYAIKTYDHWLHDNELYGPGKACDKAIKALAKAWKDVLKLSDKDLGIDPEFTRPGIGALLTKFAQVVAGIEGEKYQFAWK